MSHYNVALIRRPYQDADEMLAKYSERLEVKPYIRLSRKDALKEAAETIAKYADGTYKNSSNNWGEKLAKAKETSEDELIKVYAAYCGRELDENGNQLSTYNPLSKYDYYGETETFDTLSEYIKKYPAYASKHKIYKARVLWRHVVEGKPLPKKFEKDEYFQYHHSKKYYLEKYGDIKLFIRMIVSNVPAYAFVLDGEWYSPGEVGMFAAEAVSGVEETKKYLDVWENIQKDPQLLNSELIIYDMHI